MHINARRELKQWRHKPTCPTSRSPALVKATTEGVVRPPSALVMMVGLPPSMAATAELVVPRSMPTTCACSRETTGVVGGKQQRGSEQFQLKWGRTETPILAEAPVMTRRTFSHRMLRLAAREARRLTELLLAGTALRLPVYWVLICISTFD